MELENIIRQVTYKDAGVDIELGDECSRIMYEACKKTWENRRGKIGEVKAEYDDFSGLRFVHFSGQNVSAGMNFDGVGTKIEAAERLSVLTKNFGAHRGIAFDLFAMVCDDAAARGAEPVDVGSILDVNKLDKDLIKVLAEGMVKAAKEAGVAVINGEIAELGERVGGFGDYRYNWGATALWVVDRNRMISGKDIAAGDKLVGFKEEGFRSNGLSLVRKILKDTFGEDWHQREQAGKSVAEWMLAPSKIYCRAITEITGGFGGTPKARIKGIAHITGGGLPGKLGRVLKPAGLGAEITEPFQPGRMMLYCQEWGKVEDKEAYRTWNMGNGMVVVTDEPETVIDIAGMHKIEAKVIGKVRKEPGIRIFSRGKFSEGEELVF
jgi:phosphoribosylformylglycinamidine cyclo-ligase